MLICVSTVGHKNAEFTKKGKRMWKMTSQYWALMPLPHCQLEEAPRVPNEDDGSWKLPLSHNNVQRFQRCLFFLVSVYFFFQEILS